MAILDKPDIQVLIDAYTVKVDSVIVANGVGAITGPILNDVLQDSIEILTDIKDSYYNLLSETRTAASTSFSPAVPSNYDPAVTNSKEAHDQEVQRIKVLEDNIIIVLKANADAQTSYLEPIDGIFSVVSETLDSGITSLSYLTTIDGGENSISHVDLSALQVYIDATAISPLSRIGIGVVINTISIVDKNVTLRISRP